MLAGLEVLDRRIVAAVEQRAPIIIGADVHPALVGADRDGDVVLRLGGRRRRVKLARMVGKAVHAQNSRKSPFPRQFQRKAVAKPLSITGDKPLAGRPRQGQACAAARSACRGASRSRQANAALAQLVEHIIRNDGVVGSSPPSGTTPFTSKFRAFLAKALPLWWRFFAFRTHIIPQRLWSLS